jgi:hypothetical protein
MQTKQNRTETNKKRNPYRRTNQKSKNNKQLLALRNIIKGIRNVDALKTAGLVEISRRLFTSITFCKCSRIKNPTFEENDYLIHKCHKFDYHDYEHTPICRCCQTKLFSYYLGRCMEKLADENKLPEFLPHRLSRARIRDRTFAYERNDVFLKFSIWRHYGAWSNSPNMRTAQETYSFDFNALQLHKL